MVSGYSIRIAQASDSQEIGALIGEAFGAASRVKQLVELLRIHPAALRPIELVAQDSRGRIVGHAMLSGCLLDAPKHLVPVMTLSPLAVDKQHRGRGIGGALVREMLVLAGRHTPLVFLEGDPAYYRNFGFRTAGPLGFRRPSLRIPEPAFQVRAIGGAPEPGMLGTFVYSEPFWTLDCVGLR